MSEQKRNDILNAVIKHKNFPNKGRFFMSSIKLDLNPFDYAIRGLLEIKRQLPIQILIRLKICNRFEAMLIQ